MGVGGGIAELEGQEFGVETGIVELESQEFEAGMGILWNWELGWNGNIRKWWQILLLTQLIPSLPLLRTAPSPFLHFDHSHFPLGVFPWFAPPQPVLESLQAADVLQHDWLP